MLRSEITGARVFCKLDNLRRRLVFILPALAAGWLAGCRTVPPGAPLPVVKGDEMVVAGKRIHTGTRIVTWTEPRGYNAYAGRPPLALRRTALPERERRRIAQQGWTLPALQKTVDQFVLHYDACGLSKVCFEVLHQRGLNVHFLLDVDGTIYQTLDLQERALHATISNDRSIGIEIANIGAFPPEAAAPLREWYRRDGDGTTRLTVPPRIKAAGILTPDFRGRPARPGPIAGAVQGRSLVQYDLTPEQYAALTRLTAAICRTFPLIRCEYPQTKDGQPLPRKLPDAALAGYRGILGHHHIQENKTDPGPAFQWQSFVAGVRALLSRSK